MTDSLNFAYTALYILRFLAEVAKQVYIDPFFAAILQTSWYITRLNLAAQTLMSLSRKSQ
jgi:hypothetical protein